MGIFNYDYKHPGFPTPPLSFLYDLNFGIEIELSKLTFLLLLKIKNILTLEFKIELQYGFGHI